MTKPSIPLIGAVAAAISDSGISTVFWAVNPNGGPLPVFDCDLTLDAATKFRDELTRLLAIAPRPRPH